MDFRWQCIEKCGLVGYVRRNAPTHLASLKEAARLRFIIWSRVFTRRIENAADRIPILLHGDVHGIQFDQHRVSAKFGGDIARGSAAGEWIEDGPALWRAGQYARPHQRMGKHREVRSWE